MEMKVFWVLQLVLLVRILLTSCVVQDPCNKDFHRADAFRRCVVDTSPLPPFNTTKPTCALSTTQLLNIAADSRYQQQYYFGCEDLTRFADYADMHESLNLVELLSINLSTTHSSHLEPAASYCYKSAIYKLSDTYGLCWNPSPRYNTIRMAANSCLMEFMHLVARETNGDFSEKIYTFLTTYALNQSYSSTGRFDLTIIQHYLHTCTSADSDSDLNAIENCVLGLLDLCHLLDAEYYYYLCYRGMQDSLCSQFNGDENLRCYAVLDTRRTLSLQKWCSFDYNEIKCESLLSDIIDQKPISQLNSSDVDQVAGVVAGSSKRSNYTNKTLTQLNRIVEYFSLNESAVAGHIDKQDANTFLSVISTLASEDGTRALKENSTSNSGAMLLHDLDEVSKLIGSAVVTETDQVEGNYAYNDDNIGLFLAVGSSTSYSSGSLKLNKTNTNTTAAINISSTSVCGSDYETSGSDDSGYYDYPKVCQGLPSCIISINGYLYTCFDLFTIFGDCSRTLKIPSSCPAVVVTSIADKLPLLLTNDLPSNTTIASLVLSSQIVMKNEDNSTSVTHSLKENAILNFKLFKPINRTQYTPKCYYWDTVENVWSDEGVETQVLSDEDVQCTTNHLTSFAVLVDHKGLIETTGISSAERQALSIVGYIGPSFSLVCIIIALVIMICLREKMNTNFLYFIHLNLCISLLLALTLLILGLETADHYRWLCAAVAGLLHYLFLCVFAWMMAEGITLFVTVVYVWGMKFLKWQIFLPAAWGIPLIIVAISVGIRHDLYGTNNYCWLSSQKGLLWAFLGPAIIVSVINTIFLTITVIQLVRVTWNKLDNKKKLRNIQIAKTTISGTIILFPLLGITWIIGVFAISQNTTVFLWLFTICNSLQGVFILIFHVLRHKAVLTWIARKFPCTEKWIEVHTSAEMTRRMSAMKLSIGSLAPKEMLSAKFGLRRNSTDSLNSVVVENQVISSELDTIAEEEEDTNTAHT